MMAQSEVVTGQSLEWLYDGSALVLPLPAGDSKAAKTGSFKKSRVT
jgi:hypothetical protein